jgi:ABC-type thiamine transport system substrate-binding protein
MNKNPKFNWFPFVFIAIVVLLVLLSCNSVNKARGKTETLTIYEYDTLKVSVVDTTRTLQEWIEFQTKTVELFDTTYTTVPILRKRIIYENVKASSKEVAMGVSRDSVKATGTITAFSQSDYRNKETKRLPFWLALSIVAVISFVIYKLWREK